MCVHHRFFFVLSALPLLLLIPPEVGHAQQGEDDWYRGFRYDSLFRVGADDFSLTSMGYLKDSLHFDFIRNYTGPSQITDSLLFLSAPDAADTAWIDALGDERTKWYNRLLLSRSSQIRERGLKVIYAFDPVADLQLHSRAIEALFDYNPMYVHAASFAAKLGAGQFTFRPDTLFGGFAHAIGIDSSTSAGLTLLAGRDETGDYGTGDRRRGRKRADSRLIAE